jgi:hypothetical protein
MNKNSRRNFLAAATLIPTIEIASRTKLKNFFSSKQGSERIFLLLQESFDLKESQKHLVQEFCEKFANVFDFGKFSTIEEAEIEIVQEFIVGSNIIQVMQDENLTLEIFPEKNSLLA